MSHISRLAHGAAAVSIVVFSLAGVYLSSPTLAAQSIPPLAAPTGTIVNVSTEAELQAAAAALQSNTTIVLAPGTYTLTNTLVIRGPLTNVGIRGATSNADDVVLVGRGMTNADFGAVPHGIATSGDVRGITVANLTIRDISHHPIVLDAGAQAPRLYNLHLLNAGRQFVKAGSEQAGVHDGVIEYSTIEYTTASAVASVGAVEVIAGQRWVVRKNLFRNIKAPSGLLAGPAVLMWRGSRQTVTEGNIFINSQREIAYGNEQRRGSDHSGGIIRNNFIYRESSVSGDAAIQLVDSPNSVVVHNTILVNGTAASPIEYRLAGTTGIDVRNNLLDGPITGRDGASGTVEANYTRATADMFANAAAGDLHILSSAAIVIDGAEPLSSAATDMDGQSRPQGGAADYGADELTAPAGQQAVSTTLLEGGTQKSAAAVVETDAATTLAATATAGLPAPWKQTGVGNPQQGFVGYGAGVFAVQAGGTDIGGSSDHFWFVYQPIEGDGEIVARVESLYRTHVAAKAGVMIREELVANSRHAFATVTAAQGLAFQRRPVKGGSTVSTSAGNASAPYWVKLRREGSAFTAFSSKDGSTWTEMGTATISMNRAVYVGLAVTSHSSRVNTNAVFTNVAVGSDSGDDNNAPTVAITSPASGATYKAPASITIAAQAADPDGSIAKVDFFAGSSLIGSDSTSPYSVTWSNVSAGPHVLQAVAHDKSGAWTPSSPVEITVSGNQPPSVTLTSPKPDATFPALSSITMTATASDADGKISKVEFFAGSKLIASDTTSPYAVTWTKAPAGTYTLSAKAWDNGNASMISAGVNVKIGSSTNEPPTVSLTIPSGTDYAAPATITLTATAQDADGVVEQVEFYAGSKLIGADSSSPFSIVWGDVPAGAYSLTAVARDDDGSSRTSSPVSISVTLPNATLPKSVMFSASPDHASVMFYSVEVYKAGSTPGSSPFRTQNAGKPTPVNGEITVSIGTMIQALPAGSYFITVSATGEGGTSRSSPSETFVR